MQMSWKHHVMTGGRALWNSAPQQLGSGPAPASAARRACSSGVAGIQPARSAPYLGFWPPAASATARLTVSGVASLTLMSHLPREAARLQSAASLTGAAVRRAARRARRRQKRGLAGGAAPWALTPSLPGWALASLAADTSLISQFTLSPQTFKQVLPSGAWQMQLSGSGGQHCSCNCTARAMQRASAAGAERAHMGCKQGHGKRVRCCQACCEQDERSLWPVLQIAAVIVLLSALRHADKHAVRAVAPRRAPTRRITRLPAQAPALPRCVQPSGRRTCVAATVRS